MIIALEDAKYALGNFRDNLEELGKLSPAELKDQRYQKFRTIGDFLENSGSAE